MNRVSNHVIGHTASPPARRRSTIRDVAAAAGVSHQTVSRVINGEARVAAATRERVLRAVAELEYVPSPLARGLGADRTHCLGMVTADVSDHFFAEAVAGAELEARRRGYFLMVASVEETAADDGGEYLRLLLTRRVEGLILARPSHPLTPEQLAPADGARIPLVTVGSSRPAGHTTVDVDNRSGGHQAASHLLARGHRAIATITGPLDWPSAQDRLEGFAAAHGEWGASPDDSLVERSSEWTPLSGQAAIARLLARGASFTAVFAHNDLLALGAIRELRARGLRVPEDVSVVGFDDIPIAAYVDPPLTTIRQPMREVGALAASVVIDALTRESAPQAESVHRLPATLVVRESVAAPA